MGCTPGQQRCIDTLSGAVVVSAGAGSGKTFTLTRRIVNALESGFISDVSELLAITFTSKAAGEIKSRVKGALRAAGMPEQALRVDGSWISTIHGMCARILRENALELGVSPTFEVADEAVSAPLLDAAIEEALACCDAGSSGSFAELFSEYRAHGAASMGDLSSVDGMVRALIGRMSANPAGLDALRMRVDGACSAVVLADRICDTARAAMQIASAQKAGASRDAFISATEEAVAGIEAHLAAGKVCARDLVALVASLPVPSRRFGTAECKDAMEQFALDYAECALEARLLVAEPAAEELVALAEAAMASYARRKRELGLLDNDDLLVMASRAFAEHPEIEQRYASRFKLVMVDEFQDTDQQQVDMIKRLSGEDCERLCTVGDAQQSIYRFRGADVSVYRRHLDFVASKDADGVIVLPHNFRSHADVLSFVDRVFEQPSVFGGSFMSLSPARDEARVPAPFRGEGPRIEVQLTTRPFRGVSAEEGTRIAAGRIAESFKALRDAGHSAGDMVILLGSMSRSQIYADALRDAGFACVVAGGSVFNQAPEVQMMVDAAAALSNPGDTESLLRVLSSPMFVLSADDLLELATMRDPETGSLRRRALDAGVRSIEAALREGAAVPPALECAVRAFAASCRVAVRRGLSEGLQSLVVDSGLLSRLESEGAEGRAKAGNVLKAIRMARIAEQGANGGLASASKAFELRVALAKEAPGALSAAGGDFVRIMTVHASKGLEFPIVAVAELREGAAHGSKLSMTDMQGRTYASLDMGRTADKFSSGLMARAVSFSPFDEYSDEQLDAVLEAPESRAMLRAAIKERERRGNDQEAYRLLYVALTRAKEALVVSLSGKRSKACPSGCSGPMSSAIAHALFGPDGEIPEGSSFVGFGGTRPALVERVDLEAVEGAVDVAETRAGRASSGDVASGGHAERDVLVHAVCRVPVRRFALPSAREGVVSYSSIAHGAPVDVHDDSGFASPGVQPDIGCCEADAGCKAEGASMGRGDADKATDLGTAFHRLAQLAVIARPDDAGAPLRDPGPKRFDALCRSCNVSDYGRLRLRTALDAWFASDTARDAARHTFLRAEVPFSVEVPMAAKPLMLEGEIDLLAYDEPASQGGTAFVFDYKTGGNDAEDLSALHAKHLLQAQCYAFAVLAQGFSRVEACFIRVERPCSDEGGGRSFDVASSGGLFEPQCVRYAFTDDDRDALAAAVVDAYRRSR